MNRLHLALALTLVSTTALAQDAHLSRFGAGDGPSHSDGVYRLLDAAQTPRQRNAVAFDRVADGPHDVVTLTAKLRVLEGGDGGAFVFLNTAEFGAQGPAPFLPSVVEPNLRKTFAVGIDVHNPKNEEMFGPWGNYMGKPEREISLHWDGREILKRLAPEEFRGDFSDLVITLRHVIGGANVTVELGGAAVYDEVFMPSVLPYESRLAIAAGTRGDASTEFDVRDIEFTSTSPTGKQRLPKHFEIFNHVLTDNTTTTFENEVDLPPASWAFGRVILTLEIHDAGENWDEWDRNAEVSIFDAEGRKRGIVPFITSYRTECTWQVDVTHFRPFLSGKTRFEIAGGTKFYKGRGFMMSLSLDFHHGRPELEPYEVVTLWHGTARYKSAANHFSDFFPEQEVAIPADAEAARVFITTTGHSQIGEFVASPRAVTFVPEKGGDAGADTTFVNVLWKDDCYLNPNRPQFGSWKFSRAGWAPGDIVWPWWIDVSPLIRPGKTAVVRYAPQAYDFTGTPADQMPSDKAINEASHVVRAYLILYRDPAALTAAPSLQIVDVVGDSNAAVHGVKKGDYLASYEGAVLESVDDLRVAIQGAAAAGKKRVKIVVYRGIEPIEIELDAGRMGVNLSDR